MFENHPPARLRQYRNFQTEDPDQATEYIASQFRDLKIITNEPWYFRSMNTAQLDLISITESRVSGQEFTTVADDRFYIVVLYATGGQFYQSQGHRYFVPTGSGILMLPDAESRIKRTMALMTHIAIAAPAFNAECDRLAGRHLKSRLAITGIIDRESAVHRLTDTIITELDRQDSFFALSPVGGRELQLALIAAILQTTPNSALPIIGPSERGHSGPFWHRLRVRKAEEYMDGHLMDAVSPGMLASAAGVGVDALRASFRSYRNAKLKTVLKNKRLDAARDIFLREGHGVSIKEVMYRFVGWKSASQFTSDYVLRHGETPSQTQDKSRA
jgi:AraC-like DNA-binding protein